MTSPQFDKLLGRLWDLRSDEPNRPLAERRAASEANALPAPDGVAIDAISADGISAVWLYAHPSPPDEAGTGAVLYLHGGGFAMGSLVTHRKIAGELAKSSRLHILLIDYRLAPEHPFPAAIEDAVRAYRWLLRRYDASQLTVGGDSAGGGLALATLLELRNQNVALPAAVACISPWVDLVLRPDPPVALAERDPITRWSDLVEFRDWYLGDIEPRSALASPVFADLSGLPPLLVHVGDSEIFLPDARRLAARAESNGVDVTLKVWPEMFHVWHTYAGRVPESTAAVNEVGAFLRAHVRDASAPATWA